MNRVGFIFPGQGSQIVGMGKDLYENSEVGKTLFDQGDRLLGYHLSRLCFAGPEQELTKTEHTQPALFICSAILLELLKSQGIKPGVVAGHSVGEYSALYAAEVFDFKTGLRLVAERGKLMRQAGETGKGTMTAIIGLDRKKVAELCSIASQQGIINPANFNSPQQIVVSGEEKAIEVASELAATAGAKRVVRLPVSGAFHSPLMAEAAEKMGRLLDEVTLKEAKVDFINNAEARLLREPEEIKASLKRQITGCVRWVDIIKKIEEMGYETLIEVGPGKVLTGLVRKTTSALRVIGVGRLNDIETTRDKLKN